MAAKFDSISHILQILGTVVVVRFHRRFLIVFKLLNVVVIVNVVFNWRFSHSFTNSSLFKCLMGTGFMYLLFISFKS